MNIYLKLVLGLALLSQVACSDDKSKNDGKGAGQLTHEQLANEFVRQLRQDLAYDVSLVKANSIQQGFIVVKDKDSNTFDAYDVSSYVVGTDMNNYLNNNSPYIGLTDLGNGMYEEPFSGVLFEKGNARSKDLLKMEAIREQHTIRKSAEFIAAEYGLSVEKSMNMATITYQWKTTSKDRMTDEEHDYFSKEIFNHTITDYKAAANKWNAGDKSELISMVDDTAAHLGTTPEDADEIIEDIFKISVRGRSTSKTK